MTNFITNNLNFDNIYNIYYITGIIILTGGSYFSFKYFIFNKNELPEPIDSFELSDSSDTTDSSELSDSSDTTEKPTEPFESTEPIKPIDLDELYEIYNKNSFVETTANIMEVVEGEEAETLLEKTEYIWLETKYFTIFKKWIDQFNPWSRFEILKLKNGDAYSLSHLTNKREEDKDHTRVVFAKKFDGAQDKIDNLVQTDLNLIDMENDVEEKQILINELKETTKSSNKFMTEVTEYLTNKLDLLISNLNNLEKDSKDLDNRIEGLKNIQKENKVLLESIKDKGKGKMVNKSVETPFGITINEEGIDEKDYPQLENIFKEWLYDFASANRTMSDSEMISLPKDVLYDVDRMDKYLTELHKYVNRSVGGSATISPIVDKNNDLSTQIVEEVINIIT